VTSVSLFTFYDATRVDGYLSDARRQARGWSFLPTGATNRKKAMSEENDHNFCRSGPQNPMAKTLVEIRTAFVTLSEQMIEQRLIGLKILARGSGTNWIWPRHGRRVRPIRST
jgi:hypothetical protein